LARIPYVDLAHAKAETRATLEALPAQLNIFRMLANCETTFRPFLRLGTAILASNTFDPKLRELVILLVGKLAGCRYEWVQHVPIAKAVGASDAQISALEAGRLQDPSLDARERAVLRFASEALSSVKVSEAAFREAARHLSPSETVELLMIVGFYRTIAILAESTEIEIDDPLGMTVVNAARGGRATR
jgi:AhpD family alkylhydroperoxidase